MAKDVRQIKKSGQVVKGIAEYSPEKGSLASGEMRLNFILV
jgi:hypothetical protein